MTRKKVRHEHQPPPLVQVVPGVAHIIGNLALLRPLLAAMGIKDLVDRLVPMQRERDDGVSHGDVVEVLVANRLIAPRPMSRIAEWADGQGVGAMFGIDPELFNDCRIGRTLDALTDGWDPASGTGPPLLEELQSQITLRFMKRFNIAASELGYDTTSLYFEGDYDDSELIRLGYSRDHRPDLKQVVMGISATLEDGVVVHGRIYPGNRADSTTTLAELAELQAMLGQTCSRVLITTDRGMVTPKVARQLLAQNALFVASLDATKAQLEVLRAIPDEAFAPARGREGYRVAESSVVMIDDSGKGNDPPFAFPLRAVAVQAEGKAERDRKARLRALRRIDKALTKIAEKVGTRRYKNPEYTRDRVEHVFRGDLRQYRRLYSIEYLAGDEAHTLASIAISQKLDEYRRSQELDGRYLIITSIPQERQDASTVIEYYKRRDVCEQSIRILKTDLKVRPIFLHNDNRVAALAYITVFALMVFTLLSSLAKRLNLGTTARHVFDHFWTVTLVKLRQLDGRWLETYLNIGTEQMRILQALGLPTGLSS